MALAAENVPNSPQRRWDRIRESSRTMNSRGYETINIYIYIYIYFICDFSANMTIAVVIAVNIGFPSSIIVFPLAAEPPVL